MIKIKNAQLNNDAITALNNLIEMNIKAGVAFKLMRVIKEISSLVEDKLKMEQKILEKHIERDDLGNPFLVYDENNKIVEGAVKIKDVQSFQNEMESLLFSETELNFEPIPFEDLGLDTIKIKDLLKIDFIFS
jgi:disulfide oxidoreductase YuzD